MDFFQVLILSFVEGVTEFLPISSTGHLMLFSNLLGIGNLNFTKSFEIAIQLGAILAVVFLYRQKLITDKEVLKKVFLAFLPTAIFGLVFYKIFKNLLLSNVFVVIWSLFLGGIILIFLEIWHKKRKKFNNSFKELDLKRSLIIGFFQAIAIIPGVSRSGATILGGLLLGIKRSVIVEFSFLLAIPTMAAATFYDLAKNLHSFTLDEISFLILGFFVSFLVAIFSIKWFLNFIKNHSFIFFGVYRIMIALLFWLLVSR
jgi:undecaprenyl-diphosphatase